MAGTPPAAAAAVAVRWFAIFRARFADKGAQVIRPGANAMPPQSKVAMPCGRC